MIWKVSFTFDIALFSQQHFNSFCLIDCHSIFNIPDIDDELDEMGIIFVTTEDTAMAKKLNIKNFPQLVFFRNRGIVKLFNSQYVHTSTTIYQFRIFFFNPFYRSIVL